MTNKPRGVKFLTLNEIIAMIKEFPDGCTIGKTTEEGSIPILSDGKCVGYINILKRCTEHIDPEAI